MSYIYRLSGENLELAEAEIKGFLESQRIYEEIERKERIAVTESEPDTGKLKRLALVHEVSCLIERSKEPETDYRPPASFKVEAHDLTTESDSSEIEKELGRKLETENNSVELEDPDEVIRIYILEDEFLIGREILDNDRGLYNKRKNQKRPFSSPVSLDPVLARVMVNLSGIEARRDMIDPFCGTGGILIEAGLCGLKPFGLDLKEEMVKGSKKNLEEYGILNHDIRQGRINKVDEIFGQKFEAVITDLPYGKASKVEGTPVDEFLEKAGKLTDGKIVFMSDKENLADLEPEFELYVHKNLTRYIYLIDS